MESLRWRVKRKCASPNPGAVLVAGTLPPADEGLWDDSLQNNGLRHIPASWFSFDMHNPECPCLAQAGLADLIAWVIRLAEEEDKEKRLSTRNRNCLAFLLHAGMEVNVYREGWVSPCFSLRHHLMSFQSETQKWKTDACMRSRPQEYTPWFKAHRHCRYKPVSPKFPENMWSWLESILDLSDEEEPCGFQLIPELCDDATGETWLDVSPTGPYAWLFDYSNGVVQLAFGLVWWVQYLKTDDSSKHQWGAMAMLLTTLWHLCLEWRRSQPLPPAMSLSGCTASPTKR
jgi:hypothetical protein